MKPSIKKIILKTLWLSTILMLFANPNSAIAKCEPVKRIQLRLYEYGGAKAPETYNAFSIFHGILSRKLESLSSEIFDADLEIDYVNNLAIIPESFEQIQTSPNGLNKKFAIWRDENNLLLLLSGNLFETKQNDYIVQSQIFWGELQGHVQKKFATTELPIDARNSANLMDSHTLVTLFALGMDAIKRKCDSSVAIHFLQHANEIAEDLKKRGSLEPDISKIHLSILHEMAALATKI